MRLLVVLYLLTLLSALSALVVINVDFDSSLSTATVKQTEISELSNPQIISFDSEEIERDVDVKDLHPLCVQRIVEH